MKQLLTALLILTVSLTYSQGTIQISSYQAKEAIKTKRRVQVLEVAIQQQGIAIVKLQDQVSDLKAQVKDSELQTDLWKENYNRLKTQYEAEKAKKPKDKTLIWVLRCIGVAAVGYVVGSL